MTQAPEARPVSQDAGDRLAAGTGPVAEDRRSREELLNEILHLQGEKARLEEALRDAVAAYAMNNAEPADLAAALRGPITRAAALLKKEG